MGHSRIVPPIYFPSRLASPTLLYLPRPPGQENKFPAEPILRTRREHDPPPTLGAREFASALALLTRLRQLACDARLLPQGLLAAVLGADEASWRAQMARTPGAAELLEALQSSQLDECAVCLDAHADCITPCKHAFHRPCILAVLL